MGEVIPDRSTDRTGELADDPAAGELLERFHCLVLGATARRPDRGEIERAADDGRGGHDLTGRLADRPDPFAEHRFDPLPEPGTGGISTRQRLSDVERQSF